MGKVALEGMEFFAYHGYYDEEQKMGNKYSVDVVVETDLTAAAQHDALAETINYELLYKIISGVMGRPSRLLESLNLQIIREVFQRFANANRVEVSMSKFNPPIGGVCRQARVTMSKTRAEIEALGE
ncbi:MAG: dihydroneopterin aldolase [Bacteroidetes bacterium]|nr:dihydroneopterin aldolase [Bacteroidota bacterium]